MYVCYYTHMDMLEAEELLLVRFCNIRCQSNQQNCNEKDDLNDIFLVLSITFYNPDTFQLAEHPLQP